MVNSKTVYAVKHKDDKIRASSRSGGIFTAVSDVVLENGGVVYGCALNDSFLAEHRRAVTKEERDAFRGSKYIQSEMHNCYYDCANDLKNGLTVLFSGTPCQIEALLNYLLLKKIDNQNLITLDILCHGVPSGMVWKDFLNEYYSNKLIEKVEFRDKKNFGWRAHVETVVVEGNEYSTKTFTNLFYSNYILRPSCFKCNYKTRNRVSDITIGDYWKIENNDIEFDDNKGVSLVCINTEKGNLLLEICRKNLVIKEFPMITSLQPALDCNYVSPINRAEFWNEYGSMSLEDLYEKYTCPPNPTIKQKIIGFPKRVIKKLIRIIL